MGARPGGGTRDSARKRGACAPQQGGSTAFHYAPAAVDAPENAPGGPAEVAGGIVPFVLLDLDLAQPGAKDVEAVLLAAPTGRGRGPCRHEEGFQARQFHDRGEAA